MSDFRDFIPAHEDPGALGNGFTDFVPTPTPQAQVIEAIKVEPVVEVEETPEEVIEPEVTEESVQPETPVESSIAKGKGSK